MLRVDFLGYEITLKKTGIKYGIVSLSRKGVFMINVSKKAPNFTCAAVVDGAVRYLSLNDFDGMYKLIFFYPLDFTFVCPTEMHALQEKLDEFKKRNVEVLGVSVDSVHSHKAWLATPREKGGIQGVTYPLLSDINKTIAEEYGVLNLEEGVALRGVFLLDADNIVQYASVNNLNFGRNINELLRVVDAVQHVQLYGDVCPANWTVGEKALKPTTESLQDYFGSRETLR